MCTGLHCNRGCTQMYFGTDTGWIRHSKYVVSTSHWRGIYMTTTWQLGGSVKYSGEKIRRAFESETKSLWIWTKTAPSPPPPPAPDSLVSNYYHYRSLSGREIIWEDCYYIPILITTFLLEAQQYETTTAELRGAVCPSCRCNSHLILLPGTLQHQVSFKTNGPS